MPVFLTEYIAFGRHVVGPLIDVDTRAQAEAVCDVLRAPDGSYARVYVTTEALVAVPGPGRRSRPRVTCRCGHEVMVLVGGAGAVSGAVPTIRPHLTDGRPVPRGFNHETDGDIVGGVRITVCANSGDPVVVDPVLLSQIRNANGWGPYQVTGPWAEDEPEPALS